MNIFNELKIFIIGVIVKKYNMNKSNIAKN